VGDQAVVNVNDLVGPVRAQPGPTGVIHSELEARTPAEGGRVVRIGGGQFLDGDRVVDLRQAAQLLLDNGRLQGTLRGRACVLPVTAPAGAGAGVRARRDNPVRGRVKDLHGIRSGQRARDFSHPGHDSLTGQRMPHEHHRFPWWSGDAPATMRDALGRDLNQVAR
jgi:hypothetical protein